MYVCMYSFMHACIYLPMIDEDTDFVLNVPMDVFMCIIIDVQSIGDGNVYRKAMCWSLVEARQASGCKCIH